MIAAGRLVSVNRGDRLRLRAAGSSPSAIKRGPSGATVLVGTVTASAYAAGHDNGIDGGDVGITNA